VECPSTSGGVTFRPHTNLANLDWRRVYVGPDARETFEPTNSPQDALFIKSLDGTYDAIFEPSNMQATSRRVIVNGDNRPKNYLAWTVVRNLSPAVGIHHRRDECLGGNQE
jgi:hypothetical protein